MSDRRQLRQPSNASVSKRPRKPSLRNIDDDKQRERKRALDRKAQRASREKTRSHIAHLEKMVQILSDKNGSTATNELMEEMGRLHAEIDRLRKIIDSIKSVLGTDILESVAPRQRSQSSDGDSPHLNESKLCEVNSPSDDSLPANQDGDHNWNGTHEEIDYGSLNGYTQTGMEVGEGMPEIVEPESNNLRDNFKWRDSLDEAPVALTSRWDGLRSSNFYDPSFWTVPNPVETSMSEPALPDFVPCKIWQKANAIYAKIFDFDNRERVSAATTVDSGSLFKFVKEGWDSLTFQERSNPMLQILKEVDQQLFWDLDPVTKIANLYKSHLLLKYYFNKQTHNLEQMPAWQRPVHLQRVRKHPIPIDFFPWPALRDRLVRHHNYYFATSEFSVHYRQHFKFSWPFGFDETYRYDPLTNKYRISPLFERYHRDVRCWSLEKVFFQKFPELIGEISVYQIDPNDVSSSRALPADLSAHPPFDEGVRMNVQDPHGFENCNFADECVMELFDELPPT